MSIFGKCLALRTTTVILWATGWYDRDTWSSPLLMHFCEEERAGERPHRGRGEPKQGAERGERRGPEQQRGAAGRCSGRQESLSRCGGAGKETFPLRPDTRRSRSRGEGTISRVSSLERRPRLGEGKPKEGAFEKFSAQ